MISAHPMHDTGGFQVLVRAGVLALGILAGLSTCSPDKNPMDHTTSDNWLELEPAAAYNQMPASCAELPKYLKAWAAGSAAGLYAGLPPATYLAGKFKPTAYPGHFVKMGRDRLRRETAFAWRCLEKAWHASGHKQKLKIVSGTRNFHRQAAIWNGKFLGQRSGYKKCTGMSAANCARFILKYSSMPGTSRHHWGTDLDVLYLENHYFKTGPAKTFYKWMTQNAAKFGFCQPYNQGRDLSQGGYMEERWHWSFRPLAAPMLRDWKKYRGGKPISGFAGSGGSRKIPGLAELQVNYVYNINPACK